MLREQLRQKEMQAEENQASSQVIKHMLQTGAAKLGDEGGITVLPTKQAMEYGMPANQMEDEQQIPQKQIVTTPGRMFDTNH